MALLCFRYEFPLIFQPVLSSRVRFEVVQKSRVLPNSQRSFQNQNRGVGPKIGGSFQKSKAVPNQNRGGVPKSGGPKMMTQK